MRWFVAVAPFVVALVFSGIGAAAAPVDVASGAGTFVCPAGQPSCNYQFSFAAAGESVGALGGPARGFLRLHSQYCLLSGDCYDFTVNARVTCLAVFSDDGSGGGVAGTKFAGVYGEVTSLSGTAVPPEFEEDPVDQMWFWVVDWKDADQDLSFAGDRWDLRFSRGPAPTSDCYAIPGELSLTTGNINIVDNE